MDRKMFSVAAGVIFAVVALFHLVRIYMDWPHPYVGTITANSELNFAIPWLRGLAKIVKNQVLRRYQMRIKGLKSRAAARNLERSFSQRMPSDGEREQNHRDAASCLH